MHTDYTTETRRTHGVLPYLIKSQAGARHGDGNGPLPISEKAKEGRG